MAPIVRIVAVRARYFIMTPANTGKPRSHLIVMPGSQPHTEHYVPAPLTSRYLHAKDGRMKRVMIHLAICMFAAWFVSAQDQRSTGLQALADAERAFAKAATSERDS